MAKNPCCASRGAAQIGRKATELNQGNRQRNAWQWNEIRRAIPLHSFPCHSLNGADLLSKSTPAPPPAPPTSPPPQTSAASSPAGAMTGRWMTGIWASHEPTFSCQQHSCHNSLAESNRSMRGGKAGTLRARKWDRYPRIFLPSIFLPELRIDPRRRKEAREFQYGFAPIRHCPTTTAPS